MNFGPLGAFVYIACASDIDSYFTLWGQATQFIETCGTKSPLYQSNFVYFWANLLFLPWQPKRNILIACSKWISKKQAVWKSYLVAPSTQWAAVKTHSSEIREAEQNQELANKATNQGNWLGWASSPPTILCELGFSRPQMSEKENIIQH